MSRRERHRTWFDVPLDLWDRLAALDSGQPLTTMVRISLLLYERLIRYHRQGYRLQLVRGTEIRDLELIIDGPLGRPTVDPFHSERTKAGQAVARAAGKRIGRPPTLDRTKITRARDLRTQGQSWSAVATAVGAPASTIRHQLKPRPATKPPAASPPLPPPPLPRGRWRQGQVPALYRCQLADVDNPQISCGALIELSLRAQHAREVHRNQIDEADLGQFFLLNNDAGTDYGTDAEPD